MPPDVAVLVNYDDPSYEDYVGRKLAGMTDFSRSNFNDVSRVKGLERTYSKFPAVISSRCRMPKD
jgi:hypothetical protein